MIARCGITIVTIVLAAAASPSPPVPTLPDLDDAEPQVRAAIRTAHDELFAAPDSAAAWGHYGSVLDVHTFSAEAARAYETAGELDPAEFRWPYLLAIVVSPDDPAASVTHLEQALDRNDAYPPLHFRYGVMMEAMGRADSARASFERAVALEDDNPYAHAGVGRCLLADGEIDRAKIHLDRAIALDDRCRPALSAMAAYARRTGDMAAARRWSGRAAEAPEPRTRDAVLAEVRKLSVSTTEVIRRVGELQEAGRADAARQTLEWLVRQNPASVRGRNKLGEYYFAADEPDAAVEQFRAALLVEPDFVPARLGLAHVLTRTGRHDEGQREYETVLAEHPASVPAHRGLAISLAAQGRMAPAAEHFAVVIELAPDDRRARLACGSALLGSGQYARAVDVLQVLVSEAGAPDDDLVPQARHALAAALARSAGELSQRHDWAAAITLLREGVVMLPESAGLTNELAWLLATCPEPALRNGDEAVKLARHAAELAGDNNCNELDTLAAAFAEAGRFDEAIATAERALEIAKRTGPAELETQIAERLRQLRTR